jgi:hypothetical protein
MRAARHPGEEVRNVSANHVNVHRRATTAVDLLSASERESLFARLEALKGVPADLWAEQGARRLEPNEPDYLVRVTSDLLALVSADGPGRLTLQDLVRQERLDRFFTARRESVGHP